MSLKEVITTGYEKKVTYDGELHETWMNGLDSMNRWNIKHLLSAFALFEIPQIFLDVGCGNGITVQIARRLGVEAYGVDQLVEDDWQPYFFHKNLVDYFELPEGKKADIVYCIEVAEHIHETAHATFCDTLCNNLAEGMNKFLIFSAARPGQDGTGHVACRPAKYWAEEFVRRGLTENDIMTSRLGLLWSKIYSPLDYFSDNLMVFHKGGIE